MADNKLIRIYLEDHHAGSVVGIELAKRCLSNNQGSPLGEFLDSFIREIEENQTFLEEVMASVGAAPHRFKDSAAWVTEKLGRLKLNGQLTGYSDLSRVVELEGLCVGLEGQLSMWQNLNHVSGIDAALATTNFTQLEKNTQSLLEQMTEQRLEAARRAFAGTSPR